MYLYQFPTQIKENKLHVNLNPALYKPLLGAEKEKNRSDGKTDSYYIYGFLSGELRLGEIKKELRSKKEQYIKVIPLLEKRDSWDEAFHYFDSVPPLIKYDLNKR